MNEMTHAPEKELTRLDMLASEARAYSEALVMNIFQLGRIFIEAKPMVPRGSWEAWLQQNSGMDVRLAQQAMQTYMKFGDRPALAGVQKSKLLKMLALPDEKVDEFVAENDLKAMTAREVEAAVRRARQEMQTVIDAEREARIAAERRAETKAAAEPETPAAVLDELRHKEELLQAQKQENQRLVSASREALNELQQLRRENRLLQSEVAEQGELLQEAQAQYDRAQNELLNVQSNIARGDAERDVCDALTLDAFSAAVRQFVGTCARMPHMGRTFAGMTMAEYSGFDELLRTIESWARDARSALETIESEAVTGD